MNKRPYFSFGTSDVSITPRKDVTRVGLSFQLANQLQCLASPSMIRIGGDDRTVIVACQKKLLRIDLVDQTQVELCTLPDPATDLSINVEHRIGAIAAGNADVAIYHLETGSLVRSMSREGAPGGLKTASANHIAMGSDGMMLVTTTSGSRIFISNIKTGQWEHIMFVKYDGCDVTVSPDGNFVSFFGAPKASEISGHLTMFRVHRGLQPIWTRWHDSDNAITSCRFSPDSNSLISCGAGDGVRVWDTLSGELRWKFESANNEKLRAAWIFGGNDLLAILGDELKIVQRGSAIPIFSTRIQASESMFALSQSGKLIVRLEKEDVLSAWKLSESK